MVYSNGNNLYWLQSLILVDLVKKMVKNIIFNVHNETADSNFFKTSNDKIEHSYIRKKEGVDGARRSHWHTKHKLVIEVIVEKYCPSG